MRASEISIQHPAPRRRVGIRFPNRLRVMDSAITIWRDLGIDVDIDGTTISIEVPRIAAEWNLGLLEYATGIVGFSEWRDPNPPGASAYSA